MGLLQNLRRITLWWMVAAASLPAQQYSFHAYRQDAGLGNLSVQDLALDPQGFLWVATQNGLYRFLGATFQRFGREQGIPEQQVESVFVASDGIVWAGTAHNLYRWNGDTFQPGAPTPVPIFNARRLVSEGPGTLLVVTGGRLLRLTYDAQNTAARSWSSSPRPFFSPAVLAANPALTHIGSLSLASDGSLWMACDRHICAWRNGVLTQWATPQGVPAEWFNSILMDTHGSVWAASDRSVLELPRNAAQAIDRTPPGEDSHRAFTRNPIALDRQGRVLVSARDGVARWDGERWSFIGEPNGLVSTHITSLLPDPIGDIWMGSTGHGLHHWVGYNDWEGWSSRQGLPSSNIWALGDFSADAASVYIGTEKGPAVLDRHSAQVVPLFHGATWTYGQVSGIAFDCSGQLWVVTKSGILLQIQLQTLRITQVATVAAYVYGLVLDDQHGPQEVPVLLTNHGLFQLDRSSPRPQLLPVPQLASLFGGTPVANWYSKLGTDLWFATSQGLLRLHNGQWSRPPIRDRIHGQVFDALEFHYISTSTHDGSLWVTVPVLHSGNETDEVWHLVPTGDRLEATQLPMPPQYRSVAPIAMLADVRGWLWLGTDDGLLAWNGSSWRHLTQESGLIWNDVNGNRIADAPDGSIWIGTSGGLGHILHPEHVFQPVPLQLSLVAIQRGERFVPLADRSPLPWSRSDLSFQFASPSVLNRSDLTFRYRIPQLQPAWIDTQDTIAHFPALSPGSYTFEVMAQNLARDAYSPVLSVGFSVLPPWWRTLWFYALCALASALLLLLLFRLRTRHLVLQKLRLEAVVQDRTRELEASREALRIQATHDGLTGLLNRTSVLALLDEEMERSRREDRTLTLVLVDLDYFKHINDHYGHLAGDEALRCFAHALTANIRSYDHAGRFGGEEFLVILPGIEPADIPRRLHSLHVAISDLTCHYAGSPVRFTCSIGAVSLRMAQQPTDRTIALATADQALYQAKNSGRNRLIYHPLLD